MNKAKLSHDKKASETRTLSLPEIATGMVACRANAHELIEESTLLLEAKRHARAYTLVHSACEELAKFFMFKIAGARLARGHVPNWKRFWQRVRSHESKIAQAEVQLRRALSLTEADANNTLATTGLEVLLKLGQTLRNESLYVELASDGLFRKPSDGDWQAVLPALMEVAQCLSHAADGIGESSSSIIAALEKPPSDREADVVRSILRISIEQLRDAGLSKEQVEEKINKLWRSSG